MSTGADTECHGQDATSSVAADSAGRRPAHRSCIEQPSPRKRSLGPGGTCKEGENPWERGGGSTDWKIMSSPRCRGVSESPRNPLEGGDALARRYRKRSDQAWADSATLTPRRALSAGRVLSATDRVRYMRQMSSSIEIVAALSPRMLDADAGKAVSPKLEILPAGSECAPLEPTSPRSPTCEERLECHTMHPENLALHRRRDINCPVRSKMQDLLLLTGPQQRQAYTAPIHPISTVYDPRTSKAPSHGSLREQRSNTRRSREEQAAVGRTGRAVRWR